VNWRDEAACATVDPGLFFPEHGGPSVKAKRICRGCPVREPCLAFALRRGEEWGIWGGLSYTGRQAAAARQARGEAA